MFTTNTVTVITAATGHRHLGRCVESVRQQTFAGVKHWVVADGPTREAAVREAIGGPPDGDQRPPLLYAVPLATGLNNWNGHRIYAAMSFLVETEFVCFLDEDNWFDPEHVESLVAAVRGRAGTRWAFALRKIVDETGSLLALDECESLGSLHPVYCRPQQRMIDANCYLLPRDLAVAVAGYWYRPTRDPQLSEPDVTICEFLLKHVGAVGATARHTVNYAVGNRPDSVRAEFFLRGNAAMRAHYPGGLPWHRR